MDDVTSGQVSKSAAEVYEAFFVPALFDQFAPRMTTALQLRPGDSVLDVACGTGVLAREAARRVSPGGSVTGVDRNEGMLAVAHRTAPGIAWRSALAEALPFEGASFDAVGCQFALMFFEDRTAALEEMWRVLRPGGRLAVAVWAPLAASPGYQAMARLLDRLFGAGIAAALEAPFVLGDEAKLLALFREAGIANPSLVAEKGTARFESIDAWLHTEIKGWTLADAIDDSQYARLLHESRKVLSPYAGSDGRVAFAAPAHIVRVHKG